MPSLEKEFLEQIEKHKGVIFKISKMYMDNPDDQKDLFLEITSDTPEISTEKLKKIHLPLEKIRKNMRMEFWSSLVIILFIFSYLVFFVENLKLKTYGVILMMSAVIVTVFYFYKFFLLYKEITDHKFTTREMLTELKTQFDLSQQFYTSYYVAFAPIIVAFYIVIFDNGTAFSHYGTSMFVIALLVTVVTGLASLYFLGKWWFKRYYGKYIHQIERLIKELK